MQVVRPFFQRHESLLTGIYGLALVASMLLFAAVGFWLYLMFTALAIPALIFGAVQIFKGQKLDTDTRIMLVAVVLFLSVGAFAYISRGISWPR